MSSDMTHRVWSTNSHDWHKQIADDVAVSANLCHNSTDARQSIKCDVKIFMIDWLIDWLWAQADASMPASNNNVNYIIYSSF